MDDCPFESDDFDLQDLYLDELAAEISLSPQKVAAEISPQKESSSSSVPPQLLEGDDWESDIYNQCIQASLTKLENLTPRSSFKRDDLLKIDSTGKHKRLRIGKRNLVHYEIFPWFHYGLIVHNCDRFRESCDDNFIEKIIDAMNYFWSRRYSAQNLRQLQQIYTSLQGDRNDTNRYCTRIIDAYRNFRNLSEETPSSPFSFDGVSECSILVSSSNSTPSYVDEIRSLTKRVEHIEAFVGIRSDSSSGSKRTRSMDGGDRACWWRIRDADYPSRRKWCHPGAVFGLYSDGVGKVRPYRVGGPQMQSILVYSVSPDITEEHPNPSDPDRYVRVVMIGEAPVHLCEEQLAKLKRLNCICDVYVNRHGKVNVRSIDRRPPTHGFLFGRTQWNPDYTMNGLPVFQGVSGVCVKIHSHTSPNQMTSLHTFITTLDQGFRKLQL